jgi:hypothetical protein
VTLDAVTRAAQARRTADRTYREAVLQAMSQHGARRTAQAAGVTVQAVRQLAGRAKNDNRPETQHTATPTVHDLEVTE